MDPYCGCSAEGHEGPCVPPPKPGVTARDAARFLYELFVFVLLIVTVIALCSLVAVQPGVPPR